MITGVKVVRCYKSLKEASERLGMSKENVRQLIIRKMVWPVYQVDNFYLIPLTSIETFKKQRRMLKSKRLKRP